MMKLCSYYQALVKRPDTWHVTATLRSFEHLAFDRTLDSSRGLFEFFVPQTQELIFVEVMQYFQQQGIVTEVQKLPNRLLSADEAV
jgi:hypothetical protein